MSENNVEVTFDRVTYWESRAINIGDYENRNFGISYAKNINKVDKTINIRAKKESTKEELDDSIKFVTEALDKMEAKIREASDSYLKDFDSINKIPNKDDRDDAIERRRLRKSISQEKSQGFRDRINSSRPEEGSRSRTRKEFLDE